MTIGTCGMCIAKLVEAGGVNVGELSVLFFSCGFFYVLVRGPINAIVGRAIGLFLMFIL